MEKIKNLNYIVKYNSYYIQKNFDKQFIQEYNNLISQLTLEYIGINTTYLSKETK